MLWKPKSQKQRNLNKRLVEYATSAGISFVSNDALIDEQTGEVKEGMLEDCHYTPQASGILAKKLKHSLYGNKPAQHQRPPTNQARPHQGQQYHHQQQHQQQQQTNRQPLLPLPSALVHNTNLHQIHRIFHLHRQTNNDNQCKAMHGSDITACYRLLQQCNPAQMRLKSSFPPWINSSRSGKLS